MKLLRCYLPVFNLAAKFAHRPEFFSDFDGFRERCISLLETAMEQAEYLEISEFEREHAFFAMVAWLDELVLCTAPHLAPGWRAHLLQRHYFQTSIGGEVFFERLSELQVEHRQARTVFLFCLQNGFNGKYSHAKDHHELARLVETQRQLCLSPEWQDWPNDADLTPVVFNKRVLITSKRNVVFAALGLSGIYAILLLLQTLYFL